jgi:hypothetical protein
MVATAIELTSTTEVAALTARVLFRCYCSRHFSRIRPCH